MYIALRWSAVRWQSFFYRHIAPLEQGFSDPFSDELPH